MNIVCYEKLSHGRAGGLEVTEVHASDLKAWLIQYLFLICARGYYGHRFVAAASLVS